MTRSSGIIFGLVVVLLVAAGVAWFLLTFERVSRDVRLPPEGEPMYNPLYALRGTLRAHGERAETVRWFRAAEWKPGPRDTLVLYGQAEPFDAQDAGRVLAWVRGGGHLVLGTRSLVGAPALAEGLGVSTDPEEEACAEVRGANEPAPGRDGKADEEDDASPADDEDDPGLFGYQPYMPLLCGPPLRGDGEALGGLTDDDSARFARIALGDGAVTLVSSLDFLHNNAIETVPGRELAYQALAPGLGRGGAFTLVFGDDVPSLLRLILRYGWPIVVPLLLALFAWLALRSQRYGTLRPLPPARRRALLEHVQAAGEFVFGRGRAVAMHRAVRDRFERRLQRRDPSLAALDGDARVLALSERCTLPASRVRHALFPNELHKPDSFFQSISTLALMRLRV
jgi:hypothetical protein